MHHRLMQNDYVNDSLIHHMYNYLFLLNERVFSKELLDGIKTPVSIKNLFLDLCQYL